MRNVFIIVNPKSGSHHGISILKQLEYLFTHHSIQFKIRISEYNNHPLEIAKHADLMNFDSIAVIGGDGTMHEVINGIMLRNDKIILPIALITAGTGNSLMHDLNCLDPKKAIMNLIKGHTRKIDLFKINTKSKSYYAFNIVGWGLPVDINRIAEKLRWLGGQRYNVASLIEIIRNRSRPVKLIIEDFVIEGHVSFFLACNTVFTGNGMKMSPQSLMDDGKLNIFYFKHASRLKLLGLFFKVFSGKHMNEPILKKKLATSFEIITPKEDELNVDGQGGYFTPIKVYMTGIQLDIFASP